MTDTTASAVDPVWDAKIKHPDGKRFYRVNDHWLPMEAVCLISPK
jgi:hypothetical protein